MAKKVKSKVYKVYSTVPLVVSMIDSAWEQWEHGELELAYSSLERAFYALDDVAARTKDPVILRNMVGVAFAIGQLYGLTVRPITDDGDAEAEIDSMFEEVSRDADNLIP